MPRSRDLPRPLPIEIGKGALLDELKEMDTRSDCRDRILAMECEFRARVAVQVQSLPAGSAQFSKFYTNPFVLMLHASNKGYCHVSEIERDILPAKLFSSMETSAGRMVQAVVLPIYGWENVSSTMHSRTSVIDGRRIQATVLDLATLKSGPRCLNDEMSKDIAGDIVSNAANWAREAGTDQVSFTYAALYGTPKQSNKKDWHVLRNIVEMVGDRFVLERPAGRWDCAFTNRGLRVDVAVRIGAEWWRYLGGEHALLEVLVALIRACISPTTDPPAPFEYSIADLSDIVSTARVPHDYNVSLLQRSQLEWLFFLSRHFCDSMTA